MSLSHLKLLVVALLVLTEIPYILNPHPYLKLSTPIKLIEVYSCSHRPTVLQQTNMDIFQKRIAKKGFRISFDPRGDGSCFFLYRRATSWARTVQNWKKPLSNTLKGSKLMWVLLIHVLQRQSHIICCSAKLWLILSNRERETTVFICTPYRGCVGGY